MTILPGNQLTNLFENLVSQFVKENLESIMIAEIKHFMEDEAHESKSRNGYYKHLLHTQYDHIPDLEVPRDRQGAFQTHVFEPYQRREGWLEEAVIQMN